jgi:phytanoyl-CoA hydroxylase
MLSTRQLTQFEDDGYLVVEDVIPQDICGAIVSECEEIVERLVLHNVADTTTASAVLQSSWPNSLVSLSRITRQDYSQYFDISLPTDINRITGDTPINTSPSVFAVLVNKRLLDVVEDIVGHEISCNPTQHLRIKLPEDVLPPASNALISQVPWHQDNGVLLDEADSSNITTVWVPITEATAANGCLQVRPCSKQTELIQHCPRPEGHSIPDALLEDLRNAVTLEMLPGSILLMHQRTVHRSLRNTTKDNVRISLDLRYQPTGEPSGRPAFPTFVARSGRNPNGEVRDSESWAAMWEHTRERLSQYLSPDVQFFRWNSKSLFCA